MRSNVISNQNVNIEKNCILVGVVSTDCLNKSMNSYKTKCSILSLDMYPCSVNILLRDFL